MKTKRKQKTSPKTHTTTNKEHLTPPLRHKQTHQELASTLCINVPTLLQQFNVNLPTTKHSAVYSLVGPNKPTTNERLGFILFCFFFLYVVFCSTQKANKKQKQTRIHHLVDIHSGIVEETPSNSVVLYYYPLVVHSAFSKLFLKNKFCTSSRVLQHQQQKNRKLFYFCSFVCVKFRLSEFSLKKIDRPRTRPNKNQKQIRKSLDFFFICKERNK